ncbi:MAG: hypothetical protein HY720_25030 [Planctomycetes bacterium]|nr:hypothetical protein [Planctomycetota bacterium]
MLERYQANASTPDRQALLELLGQHYSEPITSFIRRWAPSEREAEDLRQGFLARFIERDFLRQIRPERGSLRSFLKAAIRHYLLQDRRDGTAKKRQAPVKTESIHDLPDARQPETRWTQEMDRQFDREWKEHVVQRALKAIERRHEESGSLKDFEAFVRYSVDPAFERAPRPTLKALARDVGTSEATLSRRFKSFSEQLKAAVRYLTRECSGSGRIADQEIAELFASGEFGVENWTE